MSLASVDGVVVVAGPDHGGHRPEGLLDEGGHARPDAVEHGRRDVAAGPSIDVPAGDQRGPRVDDARDLGVQPSRRSARAIGPDVVPGSAGSPTWSSADALDSRDRNSSATTRAR